MNFDARYANWNAKDPGRAEVPQILTPALLVTRHF